MNRSDITELIKETEEFHLPKYNEIPNVGLYLEQTAKYICEALAPIYSNAITASMISNYVKKKLVENPVKKQYDREQIAYLIFIAIAKNVLSMDNISLTIEIQRNNYKTADAYNYFACEFENILSYVFGKKSSLKETEADLTDEKRMLRNIIITVAHKIYLEKYFDYISKKKEN